MALRAALIARWAKRKPRPTVLVGGRGPGNPWSGAANYFFMSAPLGNTWARRRFPRGSARRFARTEFFDERR